MKYVIISYSIPVIFTGAHFHNAFKGLGKITSAAEFRVKIVDGKLKVETFGQSYSLKIGPDPYDAGILEQCLMEM